MYLYIFICISRFLHIYIYVYTCIYTDIHTYTHTYLHICMCIYIYTCTRIYVWFRNARNFGNPVTPFFGDREGLVPPSGKFGSQATESGHWYTSPRLDIMRDVPLHMGVSPWVYRPL